MKYSQVDGYPSLVRDNDTNAILNTNRDAYENYINASQVKQQEKAKVETLARDLDTIKDEINQVKNLLQDLLNASR
jgi:hypothetical protein